MLYMIATRPHGQAQHKQEKMDQAIQVVGGGGDGPQRWAGWSPPANGRKRAVNLKSVEEIGRKLKDDITG